MGSTDPHESSRVASPRDWHSWLSRLPRKESGYITVVDGDIRSEKSREANDPLKVQWPDNAIEYLFFP